MTTPADEIARLKALLAEKDASLAEKDASLAEKDAALAEQQAARAEAEEKAETLAEKAKALAEKAETLAEKVKTLEHELSQLKKQLFGKRSEKIDPRQLKLEYSQAVEEAAEADEPLSDEPFPAELLKEWEIADDPEPSPRKRRGKRKTQVPAELPVVRDEEIHPTPEERICSCGCEKVRMGEEISRRLAHQPQRFYWREQVRVKYACPGCSEITRPPLPPAPIEKSLADTSLLADVLLSKFLDHTPLDRLTRIYSRDGVVLSKQTLWSWIEAITDAPLLGAVADEVAKEVRSRPVIQTDETGILVLDRSQPEGRFKGRMWVFCGETGELFYEYTPTKETKWPKARLAGFKGTLQADAYPGFDDLFKDGSILEAGCSAHARRKFKEAHDAEPSREEPKVALVFYRRLFACEREAKRRGLDAKGRLAYRREQVGGLVKRFYAWLKGLKPKLVKSDPLFAAVRYALNHKAALTRFLKDGRVELDNNRSERSLRQVAVGRKNWLFAGSPRGAQAAATAYTLLMSCRELGVSPREYLIDVLERLSTHPHDRIAELTPRGWQAARAAQ